MPESLHVERLLAPDFSERLRCLLESACEVLPAVWIGVSELAAAEGRVAPCWRACSSPDAPPGLSLPDFEGLVTGPRELADDDPRLSRLLPDLRGRVSVCPLPIEPRLASGDDALLLVAHGARAPDGPLLAQLVETLQHGLSVDRRHRLAEVMFQAVEQAADPMELTDSEARLLYANAAWERTFGYSVSESVGLTVGKLFRDPSAPVHDTAFYQFTLATLANGKAWTGALACRARDGRRVFCEPMVSPFSAPRDGFAGNFAVRRNLAQRMQRDQALAIAHQEFRAVLGAIPDGVAVLRDGTIYFVNAAFLAMAGRSEESVIGRAYQDFIVPEDRAQFAREHAESVRRVRIQRQDGSLRFAEISTAGEVSFEGLPATILLSRDTTDHRIAQEQLSRAERLSALGALAAGVAHEINNPLTYLMLNLQYVQEGTSLPEAERNALSEAFDGAGRIKTIVGELRGYSGSDAPGPAEPVEVAKAVASACNIVQNEIRHRARLERSHQPALYVLAREGQLVQVLVNLLVNAAQAIATAGPREHVVSVASRRVAPGQVEIVVTDTGKGVSEAALRNVFDPFVTAKPHSEGMGLGLAISKRIVESLGGTIRMHTTEGEGTTVGVLMPEAPSPAREAGAEPKALEAPPSASEPQASRQRARILVVDDEVAVATGMARMLPQYDVTTAFDAQAALDMLGTRRDFDVVLCDLMMPGMAGPELYDAACRRDPLLVNRFVFMTGGAFTERSQAFVDGTKCPVLTKPFRMKSVHGLVERILGGDVSSARG